MKKTIWGNTIVKNEDRYLWFGVKSVINYLDKLIIWDTGSTDNTIEIIELLQKEYPDKIVYQEIETVDASELTAARQRMLDQTRSDWLLLLDGDEVWWEDSIKEIIGIINKSGDSLYAIITPVINAIGDIYHYQEEAAGEYQILGRKGHFNIRAINRRIPGLHIKNDYPLEGFYNNSDALIQNSGEEKLVFAKKPLMHFTHLERSSVQKNKKLKYEIGKKFSKKFFYPEVFNLSLLNIIESPWQKMQKYYYLKALIITPLRRIKRRIYR